MKLFAPLALLFALFTLALTPSHAAAATGKAGCEALKGTAFAAVMDAPTSVMKAAYVEAKGGLPAYCAVEGYVSRNNGFVLWLPDTYQGRFLARGCGGFCGIADGPFTCTDEMRIGYACLQTDMGHKSGLTDGVWAYNNTEAEIDFGSRSTHVTTLGGKAIAAAYYAKPPAWSYFLGCSTGGRQALVEAQRFPEDFQGIASIAPALSEVGASMQLTWSLQANRANGRNILSPDKLAIVHRAVVEACDMNDGLNDGLIGDPKRCGFKLASIACKGAAAATCLTPDEAGVIAKIWAGPSNKAGRLFPTGGAPLGSEGHWGQAYIGAGDAWGANAAIEIDFWRYLGFDEDPGPTWTLDQFDFDRDPPRTGAKEAIYNGGNVDLREFKQGGGKLLLIHGLTDDNVVPSGTLDYYQGVTRFMGGPQATRPFARLFHVPGMNHCTGGEGAYAIDYLTALASWVETGVAPELLEARRPKDGVTVPYLGIGLSLTPEQTAFRRPVFAWPAEAIYAGKGDPNDMNSWKAR